MRDPSNLVKKTVNGLLDFIAREGQVPMVLPAEQSLCELLKVSRSTLAQAYEELQKRKVLRMESRSRLVLRAPKAADYYQNLQTANSKTEIVENFILEKFTNGDLKPGDRFSELQIAKELGANTVTVREVLLKISGTGLIRKTPRKQWEVIDLSVDTMSKITDFRQIIELHGLRCLLVGQKLTAEAKLFFSDLKLRHQVLQTKTVIDRQKIIELESDFHKGIVKQTNNEFMQHGYESIYIVGRFHLRQRSMTQDRFRKVLKEHLIIIDAILKSDYKSAAEALQNHFEEAKDFFKKAATV